MMNDLAAGGLAKGQALSEDEHAFWSENGYLVLRGALSEAEADEVLAEVDRQWSQSSDNDHEVDVLTGPHANQSFKMHSAPEGSRHQVYKLNNLFARIDRIRQIAYTPRVKGALVDLLGGEPMICNSLNFERGSQQGAHVDTWYMPPPVTDMMVAASFALEDVDEDNGPLFYYPGSHRIPGYRFSHGLLNEIPAEAPACHAYLQEEIASRGLSPVRFSGRKGDVFLWHAQLLHGGDPIRDFRRTRRSMVVHYWRADDLPSEASRQDAYGAYLGRTLRGEISF
jgi:phytanoyl-CoA hydroxylase